jgi:hypothetical protein
VNDALEALEALEALAGPGAPERDEAAADALGLLELVAGQDVEPAGDSDGTDGRWRIARKVAPDRHLHRGIVRPGTPASASRSGGTGSGVMWLPSRTPG